MNKDGIKEYSSCSAYFQSIKSTGYETVLQGSAQGGIRIADDATISLDKSSGLPEAVVRAAREAGASDQRLGVAALLSRLAATHTTNNHIEVQNRLQAVNDIAPPSDKPKSPGLD